MTITAYCSRLKSLADSLRAVGKSPTRPFFLICFGASARRTSTPSLFSLCRFRYPPSKVRGHFSLSRKPMSCSTGRHRQDLRYTPPRTCHLLLSAPPPPALAPSRSPRTKLGRASPTTAGRPTLVVAPRPNLRPLLHPTHGPVWCMPGQCRGVHTFPALVSSANALVALRRRTPSPAPPCSERR